MASDDLTTKGTESLAAKVLTKRLSHSNNLTAIYRYLSNIFSAESIRMSTDIYWNLTLLIYDSDMLKQWCPAALSQKLKLMANITRACVNACWVYFVESVSKMKLVRIVSHGIYCVRCWQRNNMTSGVLVTLNPRICGNIRNDGRN